MNHDDTIRELAAFAKMRRELDDKATELSDQYIHAMHRDLETLRTELAEALKHAAPAELLREMAELRAIAKAQAARADQEAHARETWKQRALDAEAALAKYQTPPASAPVVLRMFRDLPNGARFQFSGAATICEKIGPDSWRNGAGDFKNPTVAEAACEVLG